MIRARRAAATVYFDDDNEDGAAAPTWIMGLPYTGANSNNEVLGLSIIVASGVVQVVPYGK